MVILETERLYLRHQTLSDLDALWQIYANPEMTRYIPDAPKSYTETQEEITHFLNGHPKYPHLGLWAVLLKDTEEYIGRCGLLPWTIDGKTEVEIAFLIDQKHWGKGLATEAAQAILEYGFKTLNLHRLVCLIDQENLASIKVAERMGMSFEKEGRDEIGPFLLFSINKN